MSNECKGWKDIPIGGLILEAGSSTAYKTGSWRTYRPVWKAENCIHCLFCYMYCPDSAVKTEGGKFVSFDYDFCKGCGICAQECPSKEKAIVMVEESQFEE